MNLKLTALLFAMLAVTQIQAMDSDQETTHWIDQITEFEKSADELNKLAVGILSNAETETDAAQVQAGLDLLTSSQTQLAGQIRGTTRDLGSAKIDPNTKQALTTACQRYLKSVTDLKLDYLKAKIDALDLKEQADKNKAKLKTPAAAVVLKKAAAVKKEEAKKNDEKKDEKKKVSFGTPAKVAPAQEKADGEIAQAIAEAAKAGITLTAKELEAQAAFEPKAKPAAPKADVAKPAAPVKAEPKKAAPKKEAEPKSEEAKASETLKEKARQAAIAREAKDKKEKEEAAAKKAKEVADAEKAAEKAAKDAKAAQEKLETAKKAATEAKKQTEAPKAEKKEAKEKASVDPVAALTQLDLELKEAEKTAGQKRAAVLRAHMAPAVDKSKKD